jgi:hypothetical protein
MGAHVFISHSSKDKALANQVVAFLERNGVRCWIAPRDIKPGEHYARAIVTAIKESSHLVLLMSQNAIQSDHVLGEVERARNYKVKLVPLRIGEPEISPEFEYFVYAAQWVCASDPPSDDQLSKLLPGMADDASKTSEARHDKKSPLPQHERAQALTTEENAGPAEAAEPQIGLLEDLAADIDYILGNCRISIPSVEDKFRNAARTIDDVRHGKQLNDMEAELLNEILYDITSFVMLSPPSLKKRVDPVGFENKAKKLVKLLGSAS